MALITPTISTALVPFISVTCPVDFNTGSSVTYSEILSSLGSFNYQANFGPSVQSSTAFWPTPNAVYLQGENINITLFFTSF